MNSYAGKVVFVAGGTSGINLGIAEGFAAAGAKVAVMSRSQEKVDAAVATLGDAARGFAVDVRDADAVADALSQTAADWGPIDVLISGAAGNFPALAAGMSTNAFKTVIDIDLNGAFHVLHAAFPHLRKPGATVINISAAQAWLPTSYQAHVCAAKAGIDQLTRTLAMEWGGEGIRINSIAPGPIEGTEGMRRLAPNVTAEAGWTKAVPLGRLGTTTDIAKAALWLCSDDASYVTGVILPVDGGLALGGSSAISAAMSS